MNIAVPPDFRNSYAALPDRFFSPTPAAGAPAPALVKLNLPLAHELGLDVEFLASPDGIDMLAGKRFPDTAKPIALAYAGHQFGNFVPQLGDGRALLLGDVTDRNGKLRDIQLKGSGPTFFSRGGDGRAALGPVLREYIVSEAMHALGVPTTRSLAAVLTGDKVYREHALPGAVLTRVAASHLRIGTFQFFAARGDDEGVKTLADYAIDRHYPTCREQAEPYLAFFQAVVEAQAGLVARWMLLGFIHGVMNTDNMSISGETIDYGPCAFMDEYDAGTVFSSIDRQGRYAFGNQPHIAVWNLVRMAETLLPLLDADVDKAVAKAEDVLKMFQGFYDAVFMEGIRRKLGMFTADAGDAALAGDLFQIMAPNKADFTLTFRGLADELDGGGATRALFADPTAFDAWCARWQERLSAEPLGGGERRAMMMSVNPAYIPRNHRVEEAIVAAVERSDFQPFETLLAVVTKPFETQPGKERYAEPPKEAERVLQTFCGT